MVFQERVRMWSGAAWFLASVLFVAACATGLEPDRSGLTGAGGSSSSTVSNGGSGGTGAGTTTSTTTTSIGGAGGTTTTDSSSSGMTTTDSSSSGMTTTDSSSSGSTTTGPPPTGLYVQYKTTISAASTNQLKAVFNIVNGSSDPVALSAVTIRYHYTIDGDMAQEFHCDYALLTCGVVTGSFATEAGVNADHYLEVSLSAGAGTLAPGAQSGEIQARWNKTNFTNFDQSNDYSFDGTLVDFTTWDKVTAYYDGTLVWGTEP